MKPVVIARNKYRGSKHTKLIYMTYVLTFPDGDQWVKQRAMSAHDMAFELTEIIKQHKNSHSGRDWRLRCEALWRAGECWWKDNLNVEHLILLEDKKRPKHQLKWGTDVEGLFSFRTETGTEEPIK